MLIYTKDFWGFYKQNQQEIKYIIQSILTRFRIHTPLNEILPDILIRMYDEHFLDRFNPNYRGYKNKKVKFSTWFIRYAQVYVLTATYQMNKNQMLWMTLYQMSAKIDVNNVPDDSDMQLDSEVVSENLIEKIKKLLSRKNNKNSWILFEMLLEGYRQKEMEFVLNLTRNLVSHELVELRNKVEKFLTQEGYTVQRRRKQEVECHS
jgi:hypothetical protein